MSMFEAVKFSRAAVAHLFSLLEKDPPPAKFEAPDAQSFSARCYAKGGIVGLRSACRKYPVACAFLNQFVRSVRPDFKYSSISLFQDLRTGLHKDSKNAAVDNLLIPVSDFKGGGIWLEGPVPMCRSWMVRLSQAEICLSTLMCSFLLTASITVLSLGQVLALSWWPILWLAFIA